MIGEITGSAH